MIRSDTDQDTTGATPESAPAGRRRRLRQRPWFRLLVFLAVLYVAWCATLFVLQDWLLFSADMAPRPLPLPYSARTVQLERPLDGGGHVVAWFVPAPGLGAERPAPLAVFFHGNAEIIDYQHTIIEGYQHLGCSVLLPEYRGYGRSAGKPSEAGIVEDALYFYDQIVKRPDVDASRLVIHGRSLGGGPAARLAVARRPPAMILESTFTSAAAMAHRYYAPMFLARSPFRVDRVLESLDAPVLLFHGTHDDIIPVSPGRRLREIARDVQYVEFDCAHNDFPGDGNEEEYWREIAEFLVRHGVIEREITAR